ncbi:transcriptional regulator [Stenotrophomonas sp. ZAC14D2_NAIMI4_7]|nr:transcriptional regulator [Stenotrophomonas sp. ZAC14D2_NAIMI4_7]
MRRDPAASNEVRRCVIGGQRRERAAPLQVEPDAITFATLSSLAAVLSDENRSLLRLLHELRPSSLTELSEHSGRRVPSLSRTLRMMEGYGLVELKRVGASVRPNAVATRFIVELD